MFHGQNLPLVNLEGKSLLMTTTTPQLPKPRRKKYYKVESLEVINIGVRSSYLNSGESAG